MDIVNMHEAKTHLSRLVEKAARGESFIIAKAGKPMVKVVPVDASGGEAQEAIWRTRGSDAVPSEEVWREMDKEVEAMFLGDDQ